MNSNATPLERLEQYLTEFDGWQQNNDDNDKCEWYYKKYPEFTIQRTGDELDKVEFGESWVRMALDPNAFFYYIVCKYQQTSLHDPIAIFLYDGGRMLIPNPETMYINLDNQIKKNIGLDPERSIFYSFALDNLNGLLFKFFTKKDDDFYYSCPKISDRHGPISAPIVIFKNENERRDFINYVEGNPLKIEEIGCDDAFENMTTGNGKSEIDVQVLKFCNRLMRLYLEWRT